MLLHQQQLYGPMYTFVNCMEAWLRYVLILPECSLGWSKRSIFKLEQLGLEHRFDVSLTCL